MKWKKVNEERKVANDAIYIEIADELGIPESKVREYVKSQSDMFLRTIKTGAFETFIMPYLGKAKVNPRRVQVVYSRTKFRK
jgi:predicted transcriptional regulator